MVGFMQMHKLPLALKRTTSLLFSRYLFVTNTAITVGLGCTGDILQQNYELVRGRQNKWDRVRTSQVFITGFVIGPTCHLWYKCLDHFLPGRSMRIVVKKVIIDQVVFSPVNICMFLALIGYLNGLGGQGILRELKDKGLDLLKAECVVWPPAQVVNFLFVPPKFRVLYDNSVSLAFDSYYSYVTFSRDRHRKLLMASAADEDEDESGGKVYQYHQNTIDELEDEMMDTIASNETLRYTCQIAGYHTI